MNADTRTEPKRGRFADDPQISESGISANRYASAAASARASGAEHRNDIVAACHFYRGGWDYAAILWATGTTDTPRLSAMSQQTYGTYHFGEYTLRPTADTDLALAVKWTAADADHAGRTRPEFWLEQAINRYSFMLEDREGPVFFFKVHRLSISAVELHCQFPPTDATDRSEGAEYDRQRVQRGIIKGFDWLEGTMKLSKITDVFFDSTHTPLRAFAVRRLGFLPTGSQRLQKHIGGN